MISNHAFHAIYALDLTPIKRKLMHPTFGEGWSQTKADAMEEQYRRFLYLQVTYPDEQTAPTLDVDTFWHYHILDTVKYAADCAQAFGYFLHHYPYLGLMEDDEPGVEIAAAERTGVLYEATFGEPYLPAHADGEDDSEDDDAHSAARCNALCTASVTRASAARCNALCTAAATQTKAAPHARCNALCTAAAPQAERASHARCGALCAATAPQHGKSEAKPQPLQA